MSTINLTIDDIELITHSALRGSNVSEANARAVSRSIVAAELDGLHPFGLGSLAGYCEQARCGKINGNVTPLLERLAPASLRVDALDGFAHPAIDIGLDALVPLARQQGVAALSIINSGDCGVLGHYAERLATHNLVALGLANTPALVANTNGSSPVLGANPVACAVPDDKAAARLLIDQSATLVSLNELQTRHEQGQELQSGWAQDRNGQATTDATAGLAGSLTPAGAHKGVGIALIVELLAATLTGANLGVQASSHHDTDGEASRTGQFFIAFNPVLWCSQNFQTHLKVLLDALTHDPGTRLPGDRRQANREQLFRDGIEISRTLHERLLGYTIGC